MTIWPVTLREANAFVFEYHRHHGTDRGCRFCLGAFKDDRLVGVAIVGRPKARMLQDRWTAEVTRLCTDGTRNACSALYGACWRAWRAMGGRKLITYTLATEPGASLRGAGWRVMEVLDQRRGWDCPSRPRENTENPARIRWETAA